MRTWLTTVCGDQGAYAPQERLRTYFAHDAHLLAPVLLTRFHPIPCVSPVHVSDTSLASSSWKLGWTQATFFGL